MMNEFQPITRIEENDVFLKKKRAKLQKWYVNEYMTVNSDKVIPHKNIKPLNSLSNSDGIKIKRMLMQDKKLIQNESKNRLNINGNKKIENQEQKSVRETQGNTFKSEDYILNINQKNQFYLKKIFDEETLMNFNHDVKKIQYDNIKTGVDKYSILYERYVKENYRKQTYPNYDKQFSENALNGKLNLVFGDSLELLKKLPSESIQVMVTSPPYYNAREYSKWNNLDEYLDNMKEIIKECYRVLDNHRAFLFNVGDIFDNPNRLTRSTWGKERIPLGMYFINIFEEAGFKFVDDFIWDKGEVQSARHKNSFRPYPLYQYPINSYEHIFVFMKHRLDKYRYPCPICGSLKVNGNTQSEPGVQSWECKNYDCFERSKSNRGKRFSLISNIKQRNQNEENKIDEGLIQKWRRDIVKFPPVIKINSHGKNTLGHTAPFPEDIPEYAVKAFSFVGETLLDPFAGSFTSAIVAAKYGRIGIGFELHKENIIVAKKRMAQLNYNSGYKVIYYDNNELVVNKYKRRLLDFE